MSRILCVGVAAIDIVNHVKEYPGEDTEVRALAQDVRVGGNAANTAQVLAQLGNEVAWAGVISDRAEADLVRDALSRLGVDSGHAAIVAGARMPTSYITLSEANGSRSIVHYRDMPEYPAESFARIDLQGIDWVHFEGRAPDQLARMLERARAKSGRSVSLEVEKPRAGIEALFEGADLLMFSRDYLRAMGADDPEGFLRGLPAGIMATCTWGEQGAWARDSEGTLVHVAAHSPERVVDTLGAGDVFNAGLVDAICRGLSLHEAVRLAGRLAGDQCGREGLML